MIKGGRILLASVLCVVALSTFVVADDAEKADSECVTQGQFAVLMCQYVQHLEGDRNAPSCINFLKNQDIAPATGWVADQALTEAVMVELISQVGIQISSQEPDRCVSLALANMVFRRYKTIFVHYFPTRLNSRDHLDATIYDEGDLDTISRSRPRP